MNLEKNSFTQDCLVGYFDIYAFSALSESIKQYHIEFLSEINNRLLQYVESKRCSNLYLFSDCGFIFYEIERNLLESITSSIRDFCDILREVYNSYLDKGYLVRGGISAGLILQKGTIFIGNPITEAVNIERNGIAPLILFPAKLLNDLYGLSDYSAKDVPMKNERLLKAVILLPNEPSRILNSLDKMIEEASYNYSGYGTKLLKAKSIVEEAIKIRH